MVSTVLDGVLLLIFLLCVVNGARHGLINSFLGLFTTFISFVFAGMLAEFFAGVTYTLVFEKTVNNTIAEFFNSSVSSAPSLKFSGIYAPFLNFISSCLNHSTSYQISTPEMLSGLFSSFIIKVLKIVMTLIFYIIVKYVFHLLLRSLESKKFRIIDNLFGGLFGAVKGVFWIVVLVASLNFVSPVLGLKYDSISEEKLNSSLIFNEINKNILSRFKQAIPFLNEKQK